MGSSGGATSAQDYGSSGGGGTTSTFAPAASGSVIHGGHKGAYPLDGTDTIARLSVTTTFGALATFVVNPGLESVFPIASKVASAYGQYTGKRVRFRVTPTSTTGVTGNFILFASYAPFPEPPTDFRTAANMPGHVLASLWDGAWLEIDETAAFWQGPRKNVRDDGTSDGDSTFFDMCTIYVYGEASENVNNFGVVEVDYLFDMYLPTPQQNNAFEVSGGFEGLYASTEYVLPGSSTAQFWELTNNENNAVNPVTLDNTNLAAQSSISSGNFMVDPDTGDWKCLKDGVYCLCADADLYYRDGSNDGGTTTLIPTINGVHIAAPATSTGTISGSASEQLTSVYTQYITPLLKDARVRWDLFQQFNDILSSAQAFVTSFKSDFELVGEFLA
jgi:hypothetical protein